MRLSIKFWLPLFLLSLVIVPVGVFLGGMLLAGPYEGANGLFSLMGDLYKDALSLRLGAWLLLSSPVLLAAIWTGAIMLQRGITGSNARKRAS